MSINKANILKEVEDLMSCSMEGFGLNQIIECSEKLTRREKAWAKKHISWRVYVIDEIPETVGSSLG